MRFDLKAGVHHGYRWTATGAIEAVKTVTFAQDSGADVTHPVYVPGQGTQLYGLATNGTWGPAKNGGRGYYLPVKLVLAEPLLVVPMPLIGGPPEPPDPEPPPPPPPGEIPATPNDWLTVWGQVAPGAKIRLAAGDYGDAQDLNARKSGTTGQPITIAGGPGVTWDGGGGDKAVWMRDAHDLIFRDIRVVDYGPGDTGVWVMERCSRIVHERVTMTNVYKGAHAPNGHNSHGFYLGGGNRDVSLIDCGVDAGGRLSGAGVQVYHEPGPVNCLVQGGKYTGCYFGLTAWSDGSGNRIVGADLRGNSVAFNLAGAHGWTTTGNQT